jgi:hypothetical protein
LRELGKLRQISLEHPNPFSGETVENPLSKFGDVRDLFVKSLFSLSNLKLRLRIHPPDEIGPNGEIATNRITYFPDENQNTSQILCLKTRNGLLVCSKWEKVSALAGFCALHFHSGVNFNSM